MRWGVVKWGSSFEGQFWSLYEKRFNFCSFTTSRERIKFNKEMKKLKN